MQKDIQSKSLKHLAHDLNNIFTRILNSAELLKRKSGDSEEIHHLIRNIESGTYLASEIIDEAVKTNPEKIPIRKKLYLNSIITDVVGTFSYLQKEKAFFQLNLDSNLGLVNGKYTDFYRVIINLIINALEAIENDGRIVISTNNISKENIQLIIQDNGSGIDESALSHVFEEDFSTKHGSGPSGLGLSIVKNIIESYKGTIILTSSVNKGTEFRIAIPAFHSEIKTKSKLKTILIAEDENILRELLTELFLEDNYSIIPAASGQEVLKLLQNNLPDLIIIDGKMPEMDGIECIQEIRKMGITIPLIFASGSQLQMEELGKTDKLKIDRVINKPYNFDEMLFAVRELIG
jgi:two-component system cell cycle sensor histidine kinase/response regulator CckA